MVPPFGGSDAETGSARSGDETWALSGGRYDLDFSPHIGVDGERGGGLLEAGGMVRFGAHVADDSRAHQLLGYDERAAHAATARERGRWFVFAAASGRAVGMNMTPGLLGAPQRSLWTATGGETMISDAQAGIGWRRGVVQASLGYVHREVRGDFSADLGGGTQTVSDSMVAFSLHLQPR